MGGSDKNKAALESLLNLVQGSYHQLRTKRVLAISLAMLSGILALLLILLVVEYTQYLSPTIKSSIWLISIICGFILFFVLSKQFKNLPFNSFYSDLTKVTDNQSLRYLLDFELFKRNRTTTLHEAAIAQNLSQLSEDKLNMQLKDYCKNHPYRKFNNYSLAGLIGLMIIFASTSFLSPDAFKRTALFWESFEKPLPFTYSIEPGNLVIAQGDPFHAKVVFEQNRIPDNVTLAIKTDIESDYRLRPMHQDDDGSFVSEGLELYNNAKYFVRMDGHESELYTANVQLLPRFSSLTATVTPPAYTGLDNVTNTYPFSRVEGYKGSKVVIEAQPNKNLISSQLILHHSRDTLDLRIADNNLIRQSLVIDENDSLSFLMEDQFNLTNNNHFTFDLAALEDQQPFAILLQPDREISVSNPDTLKMAYEVEDDFGFTGLTLYYTLNKAYVEKPVTASIQLSVPEGNSQIGRYNWDLSSLNLTSLDKVEYWFEVTDNDEVSGYKTTRSKSHFINVQSFAEKMFEQDEREEEINSSFEQVQDIYQQMQENFQQFREQVQSDPESTWEQSQLLEDIKDQRKSLDKQVEDLQKKFDDLTKDMEESQTLSEETLNQYQELQKLLEEIDDPEILKLIDELQKNIDNLDQTELRKALEEIEFNESTYRERMERTEQLFKTLRMNAELEKMSELLKDMAEQEQRLMDQNETGEEQVQQQQNIREQLEEISKKIEQLQEKGPDRRKDKLEQMRNEVKPEIDAMDEKLQENIDDMKQDNPAQDKIKQDQGKLQQQMDQLSKKLSEAKQEMNQEQVQINILALKNILQNLILLSEAQEDVTVQTSELVQNSTGFVGQARNQRTINRNFEIVSDSLFKVSAEIPGFSNRINARKQEIQYTMERAVDFLVERKPENATTEERTALGGLNELGSMLADLIDQLNNQEGGENGGMSAEQMMEQLQKMSGEQQQLNQQIQDMINDMAGERLSQDQMERLDQMARQQNEIRKQMKNLQRSGGLESGDEILSEMERLGEEMENAINELRGGQLDPIMVERQQNILSRMLDAEKAIERRDQDEEKRRGNTAEDYEQTRPPEVTLEELRRRIRSGVNNEDQTQFSQDYQRLIERYFELLEDLIEKEGR
ncbi:MAG: DUF4175 family protein [Balneolales bacterium]